MNATQKLRQLQKVINDSDNGLEIEDAWALAQRLSFRYPVSPDLLDKAFTDRDKLALDAVIHTIEHPEAPKAEPDVDIPERELNDALRLFRKRMQSTKLDAESKLGGHALSSSGRTGVMSMEPPHDYPKKVWKELARRGMIRDDGKGFYSIPTSSSGS